MAKQSQINLKRLFVVAGLLGGLILVLGGAYAYRAHRVATSFRKMRADGLAAHDKGDRVHAVDLLGKYLAREPNDLPALIAYSKDRPLVPSDDGQNVVQTIQSLRYALRLDPSLSEQRRQLMALYVRTGYATEAMDCADTLLAANPRDLDALSTRTSALARLRRAPEALTAAAAWTDADPNSVIARLTRLELMRATQHSKEEADALAEKWAQQLSSNVDGTPDLLRGHALLLFGDSAGASGLLKSSAAAAAQHPPASDAGQILAVDLDATHQPDLATAVVQSLCNAHPDDIELRLNLARRDWDTQQFADTAALIGGVPDRARVPVTMLGLEAVALLNLNRAADADSVRRELAKRPGDAAAAWVTVIAQLSSRHFDAHTVVGAALPVLDRHDDPFLRFFLGEAYSRLGERDLAARQWQRVVTAELSWPEPAVRLCQALTELGRSDEAFSAGVEAVHRAPRNVEALVALAGAWTSAVQSGHNTNADACLKLVEQLGEKLPADGRLPPLHAALLAAMNRPADVAGVIQTTLAGNQDYPDATWERLAGISQSLGLNLQAACLAREQHDQGLTPSLAYTKATALLAAGRPADGLRSYDADRAAAQAAHPPSPTDALGWSMNRAQYLDVAHDPGALAAWQAFGDAHPNEPQIQEAVVSAGCVRADRATMQTAVDRLGALTDKQGASYEQARARWLVSFGSSAAEADEARTLLDQILRDTPDSVDAHLLSARAYEMAGKPGEAVGDLRTAVQKLPNATSLRLTLARLLQAQGDLDGAREQLAQLNPDQMTDKEQRRQVALMFAQEGQLDRAIALLRPQGQPDASDPSTQLTLATLYQQNNDPATAGAIARQLLDTHPDVAVITFYANLLAGTGKLDEARVVIDRLSDPRTTGTGNGVAELTRGDFALHYDAADPAGQSKALALFAAATTAGPTNPVTWRSRIAAEWMAGHADAGVAVAAEGLRSLPADPALLTVGRHAAAVAYADSRPELRPMLLALLRDPADTDAPASTLEVLASAAASHQPLPLLATKLRELTEQFPQFQPLRLQLIHLDGQLGQSDQAAADTAQAVQALPADQDLIRAQCEVLERAGRWSEVLAVASRWHDHFPADALAADSIKADALLHLNQTNEALATLQPYSSQPGTPAYDRVLPLLARARQASGQTDAEALMAPLLAQGASGRSEYMEFAVSSLPSDEADAWIRRAVAAMPPATPDEHLTASDMYLRLAEQSTGDESNRFVTASLEVIRPYIDNVQSPAPSVLLTAALRNERLGHPEIAADFYRRVLLASPGQMVAANNLAMILARGGHADQAVPLIDSAVKSTPGMSDLYDTEAFVLSRVGRTDDALAAIDEAVRLDPSRISFHVRQITLLTDNNRTREAVDALHALDALQYDPATVPPDTLKHLQDLRDRLGKLPTTRGVT